MDEGEIDRRRAAMVARGEDAWKPANRDRPVSVAMRMFGLMAHSADKGGSRNTDLLARFEQLAKTL